MSDPHLEPDPYGERRRYLSETGNGTWIIGGLLALFVVFGLMFAFTSRTGPDQTASNTQRPTVQSPAATTGSSTVPIGQSRPAETTGSGAAQR